MTDQPALGVRPRATEHESCARLRTTEPESCTRAGATDRTCATDRQSSARADASRRNGAQRGPKTALGKARSVQNAPKHGPRAHRFVLLAERTRPSSGHSRRRCTPSWRPGAPCRTCSSRGSLWRPGACCGRIGWRSSCSTRMSASTRGGSRGGLGLALIRDGHGPRAFDTLLRYRGAVQAEFWRTLRALSAPQGRGSGSDRAPGRCRPSFTGPKERTRQACTSL